MSRDTLELTRAGGRGDRTSPEAAIRISPNHGQYRDRFVHQIIETPGLWGHPARFGLAVFSEGDYRLLVLTELPDNPGTSVTNLIAPLSERVIQVHPALCTVARDRVFVVEHYSEDYAERVAASGVPSRAVDFDLVEFDPVTQAPKWRAFESLARTPHHPALPLLRTLLGPR